jgi:vancomycin permeability regulator SanA
VRNSVPQEFHYQRAIYIAQQNGLDAVGFNAAFRELSACD